MTTEQDLAQENAARQDVAGRGATGQDPAQRDVTGQDRDQQDVAGRDVTVLGLGNMGVVIAEKLLDAGHRVTVWNRSAGKAGPLVARGAREAGTVAEAVAASGLVIAGLFDTASVRDVLTGVDLAGKALVNVTTGSPRDARALADWVGGLGAAYLDGVMMAVPRNLGTPDALLLYSGSGEVFAAAREVLEPLGVTHHLGEDPALAATYDLALLSAGYTTLAGFLHTAAMLGAAGVAPGAFVPLLRHWLGGVLGFLPGLAAEIEARDYSHGGSTVELNRAALGLIVDTSREMGVDPVLLLPVLDLLERRAAAGHGADSFASLVEHLRAA